MTRVNLSIRVGTSGREVVFSMKSNPCLIGRGEDCDLRLESRTVSRQHCQLKLKSNTLSITDLQSRNGTHVNGKAVVSGEKMLLQDGDELKIGKYFLKVISAPTATAETYQAPDADNSADADTYPGDADDLLKDLEQFVSAYRPPQKTATAEIEGQVQPRQTVSLASQASVDDEESEPVAEAEVETNLSNQSVWQKPATTEATTDTVANLSTEETQIDLAEARRLELRRRLEEMKAKDSKEAAERALKNLFKR
jgi:predicted component of type VI protein secretion system